MRTLLVEVNDLPDLVHEIFAELSAYPGLLLEGLQLWRRVPVESAAQLMEAVRSYEPAVIAFLGTPEQTSAWCQLSETTFPRLFALGHPPAEDAAVLEAIFARTRQLRQRRLADATTRPPILSETAHTNPQQLMSGIFPEGVRQQARQFSQRWIEKFRLESLLEHIDIDGFERGLSLLGLLQSALPEPLPVNPHVLDIGCHLWSYAPFLRAFLAQYGEPVLTGLELDPWYLQADGRTRGDWGQHWAAVAGADFRIGELNQQGLPPQDLITLLMPLILPENALRWGISPDQHNPAALLMQIHQRLKPNGQALIYVGVELEFLATMLLLQELNWPPIQAEPHHCPLRQQPHGFVICLRASDGFLKIR